MYGQTHRQAHKTTTVTFAVHVCRGLSCADAIFATQEIINKYILEVSNVYMCLYYLQKAFDLFEIPVLLQLLFQVGINLKIWRLLYNWYYNGISYIRLNQHVSAPFTLERGVRQGAILSTSLFLLVMDPLLRQLQSVSLGSHGYSVGGEVYTHGKSYEWCSALLMLLSQPFHQLLTPPY